jgi:hypothetical protein
VCEEAVAPTLRTGMDMRTAQALYAVVTIDPFKRQPSGAPNPEETPPRAPFTRPRCELHLISEEDVAVQDFGAFHLPVARLEYRGEELVVDESYIPPCASIKGHSAMILLYSNIGSQFNHIQEYSTSIVQKVVSKGQNTSLALNVKKLCERSVEHISSIFFAFRNIYPQLPPIHVAESVVQLANVIKVELDFMAEKEKEEMLLYFKEWNETTPSAFESLLSAVIELEYNHYNITHSFYPLMEFMSRWKQLLEKLSELELIGRRKENDIVLGKVYKDKKKGFSLLD